MVLRVLKIRISDNIISSEYKEKMLKSKEFYNSCLYLTRFRYFEYLGHKDKLDYEVRKNYDFQIKMYFCLIPIVMEMNLSIK